MRKRRTHKTQQVVDGVMQQACFRATKVEFPKASSYTRMAELQCPSHANLKGATAALQRAPQAAMCHGCKCSSRKTMNQAAP
jgi:hypothetical protein